MIIENGDIRCITIPANNPGTVDSNNTIIEVKVPTGLIFQSAIATTGSYDAVANIWTIGTLSAGTSESIELCFTVDNVTLVPFEIKSYISSDEFDRNTIDNIRYDVITGVSCVDVATCGASPVVFIPGEVKLYAGVAIPTDWAVCDGSLLLVASYPELFAAISNTFGGDGITDFALPDLRGRVPVGTGTGAGLTARALSDTGGAETHQLVEAELPAHDHSVSIDVDTGAKTEGDPTLILSAQPIYSEDPPAASLGGVQESSVGSDTPHENMPPFISLNYIIRLT